MGAAHPHPVFHIGAILTRIRRVVEAAPASLPGPLRSRSFCPPSYGVTSMASMTTMVLVAAARLVPVGLISMVWVPGVSAALSQIL